VVQDLGSTSKYEPFIGQTTSSKISDIDYGQGSLVVHSFDDSHGFHENLDEPSHYKGFYILLLLYTYK